MALSWTLDKLGPFARSAEDCGLILQAIAGRDGKDPGSAGKSFYYTPQYARPMNESADRLRPGGFRASRAEAGGASGLRRGAGRVAANRQSTGGNQAARVPLRAGACRPFSRREQASIFEPLIASGKVDELADPAQIAGLKASLEVPAKDYLKAMRMRRLIQEAISRLFTEVDVLLAPGRPAPGNRPSISRWTAGQRLPRRRRMIRDSQRIIPAGNLAGLPALVLPCGFADNLPVALQVVGAPFSENMLLAIGKEFQTRTDWHKRRPPGV